jgi:hypothetical protein
MGFFHTGLRCRVATASLDLSRADQTQSTASASMHVFGIRRRTRHLMYRGYRGSIVSGVAGRSARGANTGHCSSDHCAGLLPGVQITVGSAVASSGSARISAAIHPGPVQVELRPHSAASART